MIKRLFILFLLGIILFPTSSKSQQLDHVLGEILIETHHSSIYDILHHFAIFQDIDSNLDAKLLVNEPFPIWILHFDQNQINEIRFLSALRNYPTIKKAQFNHIIRQRVIPNDPFFPFQWQLLNDGTIGTPNADIDADLAWDITTGGLTADLDTIVICIIDDGIDLSHADFNSNLWQNNHEIPNNEIDDDNNGYIDDFNGWSIISSGSDYIDGGFHGTAVSGIAGAKGNNELGTAGVNWDVKLMIVVIENLTTESSVIEAYTYPYTMRKIYNETGGEKGAFVVVTNSSWGVNYGQINDFPLWCAYYDALGSEGILNTAATANNLVDVDELGDIPTSCSSDYLISITSLDDEANLANAAFGESTIDLGAFGENIYVPVLGNQYDWLSGTSLAAPQVAGAIGLLYSAPCEGFISFAKYDPSSAALLLKDYILNGTSNNSALEGITLTGGQLNVNNSLQHLLDDCDENTCYPAFGIQISTTGQEAMISWVNSSNVVNANLRYRNTSSSSPWTNLENVNSPFVLQNLNICEPYEVQIQSVCDNTISLFSESFVFTSEGCCQSPNEIEVSNLIPNTVMVDWNPISASQSYIFSYKILGEPDWISIPIFENTITITDLESCTDYEYTITNFCSNGQIMTSPTFNFITIGCENCLELSYCETSSLDWNNQWISYVEISDLQHTSGNENGGYSFFDDLSVHFIGGQFYNLNIKTDTNFFSTPCFFDIWFDLNQDGIFNDNEKLYADESGGIETTGTVFIPSTTLSGNTRMRISARDINLGPCETYGIIGEVEDYCITILESSECLPPLSITCTYTDSSASIYWLSNQLADNYLLRYKSNASPIWTESIINTNQYILPNLDACTDYQFQVQSICAEENSAFSDTLSFITKGCGACLDGDYCFPTNVSSNLEWIESFELNSIHNISGSDEGYGNHTSFSTDLLCGEDYQFIIEPGFPNEPYDEYYQIFIDFNQNEEFEIPQELIYDSQFSTFNTQVNGTILIPTSIALGSTRLRVIMKYNSPSCCTCPDFFEGEVEDYCVNILDNTSIPCNPPIYISADFLDEQTTYLVLEDQENSIANNIRYRVESSNSEWNYISSSESFFIFNEQLTTCTLYEFQIRTICELGISEFSPLNTFMSSCPTTNVEHFENTEFILFPNPAKDQFSIQWNTNLKIDFLEIIDIQGRVLQRETLTPNTQNTTVEFDLKNGLYFIRMKNAENTFLKKLIVQK